MPITGPQRRSAAEPRSISAATMVRVASAVKSDGPASVSVASSSRPKTTEARVMESIIITVPPKVGVTTLLRMNSHLEMISWVAAVMRTRVVRVAGPPSTTAVMQKGMEKAAVNMGRAAPPPTDPSLRACSNVDTPTTSSEAKTIHTRYDSSLPEAFATTTGVTSRVAEAIRLNCKP